MLSIFVMLSNDRLPQLERMISCLDDMPEFSDCQKTLVVDGAPAVIVPGFDNVAVPRINGQFCWADMWAAGVLSARHEAVLYLDSDRLLPANYLTRVLQEVRDNVFVFTSLHFMEMRELPLDDCKAWLASGGGRLDELPYMGCLRLDPRSVRPPCGPGKNVMSGSTAFTRRTFLRLGGVDRWYRGHGAYADTDFHMQAAAWGCEFVDLRLPELHCLHPKLGDDGNAVEARGLELMGLDNFLYLSRKWGLPPAFAEGLAYHCGIKEPGAYVRQRLEDLLGPAPGDGRKQ